MTEQLIYAARSQRLYEQTVWQALLAAEHNERVSLVGEQRVTHGGRSELHIMSLATWERVCLVWFMLDLGEDFTLSSHFPLISPAIALLFAAFLLPHVVGHVGLAAVALSSVLAVLGREPLQLQRTAGVCAIHDTLRRRRFALAQN